MSLFGSKKFTVVAFAAMLLPAALVIWQAVGQAPTSRPPSMRTLYDKKVAGLAVKTRTDTSLPELETKFLKALDKDDYADATQIVQEASSESRVPWSSSPFAQFVSGIVCFDCSGMQRHLDAWVRADEHDPLRLAVRAQYEYAVGWHLRGHKFYSDIRPTDLSSFLLYLRRSMSDVEVAISLQDKPPVLLYFLKIQIQQSIGSPQDRQVTFERAVRDYPDYYPLYQIMLSSLQPKWGGSVDLMYKFVKLQVATADKYSPLNLLYIDLYKNVVDAAWVACANSPADSGKASACLSAAMGNLAREDLAANVQRAFLLYNHLDRYRFGEIVREPIESVITTPGAGAFASNVLQAAAEAMQSDTQLVEGGAAHNDYVIDELVAKSWYRAGHYENALKKEREALVDLPRTNFPDGEAMDRARARIYLEISASLGKLQDYVGQAAYEKASNILGGRNGYEHAICFAFFKAAPYDEVLPGCDDAAAANGDDMATYYWRAQTRIDRKQGLDALSDLERVAGSRDSLRASSAIDISMIWFGRKDNAAALNVLNKYDYLYDEKATSRDQIAVAYNNRCYAYMQLKQLHKALDDCNSSLVFGEIPDAYAKKSELEKLLANTPI